MHSSDGLVHRMLHAYKTPRAFAGRNQTQLIPDATHSPHEHFIDLTLIICYTQVYNPVQVSGSTYPRVTCHLHKPQTRGHASGRLPALQHRSTHSFMPLRHDPNALLEPHEMTLHATHRLYGNIAGVSQLPRGTGRIPPPSQED